MRSRSATGAALRHLHHPFLALPDRLRRGQMTSLAKKFVLLAILLWLPAPAPAQTNPPAPSDAQQLRNPEELDAPLVPIALYLDPLLSQVLMASTYPLEIVQAGRWVDGNKSLKGDQLKAAVDKQSWDDSVKSLVATPS